MTCKIPELDPFNPEITRLIAISEPLECYKNKDWVYVDDNRVLQWTNYAKSSVFILIIIELK